MEFRDLVAMYFERTNAVQTLWGLYITIVLGLLGFLGTAKLKPPRLRILVPMLVAFSSFAYVNCTALRSVTLQRRVAKALIHEFPETRVNADIKSKIDGSLDTPTATSVTWFHIGGDVLMIFAILVLGLREPPPPNKGKPQAEAASG